MAAHFVRSSCQELQKWLSDIFATAGLKYVDASKMARNLVEAEARAVHSHGLLLVPLYVDRIRSGVVNRNYTPIVAQQHGSVTLLDGNDGPAQSLLFQAIEIAQVGARESGISLVSISNSNHAGMLATYGLELGRRGFASIIMSNAGPSVGAFDGRGQLVGNNAFCVTFPKNDADPICLDMATGQVATGRVRVKELLGEPAPPNAVVDSEGHFVDDPSIIRRGGWVTPLGGYKGFGLSIVIDLMTAALCGGPPSASVKNKALSDRLSLSQTIIAIDVCAFELVTNCRLNASNFAELVRSLPAFNHAIPVQMPGDRELREAGRNRTELRIHSNLLKAAQESAISLGLQPLACEVI